MDKKQKYCRDIAIVFVSVAISIFFDFAITYIYEFVCSSKDIFCFFFAVILVFIGILLYMYSFQGSKSKG